METFDEQLRHWIKTNINSNSLLDDLEKQMEERRKLKLTGANESSSSSDATDDENNEAIKHEDVVVETVTLSDC